MKAKIFHLTLLCLLLSFGNTADAQHCTGITAAPYPVFYTQPDGTSLLVQGTGTGFLHYMQTTDHFTLLANKSGHLEYAEQGPDGRLRSTGVLAHNPNERSTEEQNLLNILAQNTLDAPSIRREKIRLAMEEEIVQTARAAFPTTGTRKVLVLLIQYPDLMATNTLGEFDDLMNEANYNGTGSFRDFFNTSSFNQLTLNTDVFGWYTAANNSTYYADDNGRDVARELGAEAIDAAEAAGVDFSVYDNDMDGAVDGIIFVHAGPGAEEGSITNLYIWSHRSRLSNSGDDRTYDGVLIDDYMFNPERRNNNSRMVGVGIFCHEFGHGLGLPDLYDTDDSNGDSEGIGWWGLMGSGNWAGGEDSPTNFGAWSKIELGWQSSTDITGLVDGFELEPASLTNNEVYRISTPDANEYFLLENRQNVGLDIAVPGHGMIIWHIDDNLSDNKDETHKWVDVEEAEGISDLDNNTNRGDGDDPFPGADNNKEFNDSSNPNSKRYNGDDTGTDINNIREDGTTVLFNMGCEPADARCVAAVTLYLDAAGNASLTAMDLDNGSTFDCGFLNMDISRSSFSCANLGYNQVFLNVEDVNGNTDECSTNVYVRDELPPNLNVPSDILVDCWYSPTGPDATGWATATDNCDMNPSISYIDSEMEFEDGSKVITRTWTAEDFEENISMGVQQISIPPPMTADAGEDQTVYVNFVGIPGYPYSACADLSAVGAGGTPPYTYEWSDGQAGQNVEVCPDVCTKYYVTITDANGCIQEDSLTIYAIIVECMNGNNEELKYLLCHNGLTVCTSFSSTEVHLEHGDGLGACGDLGDQGCSEEYYYQGVPKETLVLSDDQLEPNFNLQPNPAKDVLTVEFQSVEASTLAFSLYTLQGKLIRSLGDYNTQKGYNAVITSVTELPQGSYIFSATDKTTGLRWTKGLMILR